MSPDDTMIVTAGGGGTLRFWDTASGSLMWTHRAHKSSIIGIHFEGADLVTRGFTGELSRWELPKLASPAVLEQLLRSVPLRFDPQTGRLVEQDLRESASGGEQIAPVTIPRRSSVGQPGR